MTKRPWTKKTENYLVRLTVEEHRALKQLSKKLKLSKNKVLLEGIKALTAAHLAPSKSEE